LDALLLAKGGRSVAVRCRDPLLRSRFARIGLLDNGETAVIESAEAIGLHTVIEEDRNVLSASSHGLGDLMLEALELGVSRIIVGLGGTAGLDGGAGMAQALGARLTDSDGHEVAPGPAALINLRDIEIKNLDPRFSAVEIVALSDVDSPLTGPKGLANVFGPQKGADKAAIQLIDAALSHYAHLLRAKFSFDPDRQSAVGGGGGSAAALGALLKASLRLGFPFVSTALDLEAHLRDCHLVITGEGRLDDQSVLSKTTGSIAQAAAEHGIPAIAICGELGHGWKSIHELGLTSAFSIADGPKTAEALVENSHKLIASTTEQVLRACLAMA
jgi:glycerate kinase